MEKNGLISIIVPVYDVEKYIGRCVDSIINQTYKNLEIILVDDGSPDNCGKICDEYAKKDCRIKVLHIKNGGVSNARNVGIEASTGEYISFVDSDDVICPEMYEKLLNCALENNADIVQCHYYHLFEDGHKEDMKCEKTVQKIENTEDARKAVVYNKISFSVWAKLFKREIIGDIRFNTALKVSEDRLFVYECCSKASKVVMLDDVEYGYFQRESSVIHTFNIKKFYDDDFVTKIFMKSYSNDKDIRNYLEKRTVNMCIGCICGILRNREYEDSLSDVRRELLVYGKKELFRKGVSLKNRICIFGIWFMPHIFYKAYCIFVKLKGEK